MRSFILLCLFDIYWWARDHDQWDKPTPDFVAQLMKKNALIALIIEGFIAGARIYIGANP